MMCEYTILEAELVSTGKIAYSVEPSEGGGIEGTFDTLEQATEFVKSLGGTVEALI